LKVNQCAIALAVLSTLLTACTSNTNSAPTSTIVTTLTSTQVHTITAPPSTIGPVATFVPKPARTVSPLPPGASPAKGQVEKRCPYIVSSPDQGKPDVADIDGSHVYRTTRLTKTKPVGCRFYFYASPYQAIADIVPRKFASATAAYNAMVLTGKAGKQAQGKKNLVPGVDAVLYRTKFFGPDGADDWACVFAAGATMVIVHTDRNDTSLNALLLARAVAGAFRR
jgi:hypothetical protein